MEKYKSLMKVGVFSSEDLNQLYGNKNSAASARKSLQKKGLITPIKRNLYVFNDLMTDNPVADRYKIGSSITREAYISHHSALEFHGIAHQMFYEVSISSPTRFNPFEFNGIRYLYVMSKLDLGVEEYHTNRGVRVTNLERTVIDCIHDIGRAGGLEELLESLRVVTFLDEGKLRQYLKAYDIQVLYQKTGFILEQFKIELRLPEDFFQFCLSQLRQSKRYLTERGADNLVYNAKWRLYVPEDLFEYLEQGGAELV